MLAKDASSSSTPKLLIGGAKEHRGLLAGAVGLRIEGVGRALHQRDLLVKDARRIAQELARRRAVQAVDDAVLAHAARSPAA